MFHMYDFIHTLSTVLRDGIIGSVFCMRKGRKKEAT